MKNFGKYLLLIFAFLSISASSAYNYTSSEIKKEEPFSSDEFRAVNLPLFAFRENSFHELTDLSKNQYFTTHSVVPAKFLLAATTSEAIYPFFKRDLRRDIAKQLFPKHFFL